MRAHALINALYLRSRPLYMFGNALIYLQECGGIMTLTDVYCRVNRARGMEVLYNTCTKLLHNYYNYT